MFRCFTILLFPIFLFAPVSKRCSCDSIPIEQSIKENSFIAHVKILDKIGICDTIVVGDYTRIRFKQAPVLKIEIIELFKGDSVKTITEYDVNTSCEVGVGKGEEWIIFANYNTDKNVYYVGACTPSRTYKSRASDKKYSRQMDEEILEPLRKKFQHKQ